MMGAPNLDAAYLLDIIQGFRKLQLKSKEMTFYVTQEEWDVLKWEFYNAEHAVDSSIHQVKFAGYTLNFKIYATPA